MQTQKVLILANEQASKLKLLALCVIMCLYSHSSSSQNFDAEIIASQYNIQTVNLKPGQVVSNVLMLTNVNGKPVRFTLEVGAPGEWRVLYKQEKWYELAPKDTIYVPVRIVPSGNLGGNSKFVINTFIISDDERQIGHAFFVTETKKKVGWSLSLLPQETVYFKNDQDKLRIGTQLANLGNQTQDIFLRAMIVQKNVQLNDTLGNLIKKPEFNFTLGAQKDTTLMFDLTTIERVRNQKRVDTWSYTPTTHDQKQVYRLYVNTEQTSKVETEKFNKGARLSVIRLPNELNVNDYASNILPLTVLTNVSNVLGKTSFLNVNAYGNTRIKEDGTLYYGASLGFSSAYWNPNLLRNVGWNVGYDKVKWGFQVGDVSGGGIGGAASGKGISGYYQFAEQNKLNAFVVNSPRLFSDVRSTSFGLNHSVNIQSIRLSLGSSYNHTHGWQRSTTYDALGLNAATSLGKHRLSTYGRLQLYNDNGAAVPITRIGVNYGGNYSTSVWRDQLGFSFGGGTGSRDISINGGRNFSLGNGISFSPDSASYVLTFNQTYAENTNSIVSPTTGLDTTIFFQRTYSSQLMMSGQNHILQLLSPRMFWNWLDLNGDQFVSRGVAIRMSQMDPLRDFRWSTGFRFGYNRAISYEGLDDNYFVAQANSMIRYQIWSFSARYLYGPQGLGVSKTVLSGIHGQSLRLSLSTQYQFKNPHLIAEPNVSYSYNNYFDSHSSTITATMYYFTDNGWRFHLSPTYSYINRANIASVISQFSGTTSLPQSGEDLNEKTVNHNMQIQFGILRNFNVKIPFMEATTTNATCVAFYDLNGNRTKDDDEPTIENVLVRVGDKELLTNENGLATLINIEKAEYKFSVISLEDLNGWFPYVKDKVNISESQIIQIPFVKGVKVYGNVLVDREKFAKNSNKNFHLSDIAISATNGETYQTLTDFNGNFEFYLPHSVYTLSMDESILGQKFRLLQNQIEVDLEEGIESMYVSFYVIERRRKMNIKKFGQTTGDSDSPQLRKTLAELEQEKKERLQNENQQDMSPPNDNANLGQQNFASRDLPEADVNLMGNIQNPDDQGDPVLGYYSIQDVLNNQPADHALIRFKVQFGFYKGELPSSELYSLLSFSYIEQQETKNGYRRFTSGLFESYEAAQAHKQELLEKGYQGAFVVGEYDGKTISTVDALELLSR